MGPKVAPAFELFRRLNVHRLDAIALRPHLDDVQRPIGLSDAKQVIQRHAQQAAEKNTDDPGMGYDERLVFTPTGCRLEDRPDPFLEITKGFPSRRMVVCDMITALPKGMRVKGFDRIEPLPLPCPQVDFSELQHGLRLQTAMRTNDTGRFQTADQIAAIDRFQ